ncbi:HAMP domain-containing sensor histidine kinase [Fodinibius sp. Rm-B-1B1-1]|uniref:GAF domain-containing sensor histidine kinase n=1 Tax=Fodinibius alkaliphilus TaxID=3140241 RepID=UPI00315A3159
MDQEIGRLQHLSSFALDYGEYHHELKPFVNLAKEITDSPVCEINIIDAFNQWTISRTEEKLKVIPREQSVCFDTIQQNEPYEVSDLQENSRYQNRDYVTDEPYFRYYCGVQLTTEEDRSIGSICVLDQKTKEISDRQKRQLQYLADLVVQHLEKDRTTYEVKKQVHKLKERFKTLNHDLRSPINGIVGIVDLLMSDDDTVEVDTEDLLTIKDCAKAMVDEIDGVMIHDDQALTNGVDSIMLNKVFSKVENLSLPQAKNKEIDFKIDYGQDSNQPISVYASRLLVQILSNLVANAIKFTGSGGEVTVANEIYEEDDQQYSEIKVKDNGTGMPAEEVEKFNSGKKVTGSVGTEGEASFGIGLQHVRNLVSELKGQITVASKEGKGSTFTVTVALANL